MNTEQSWLCSISSSRTYSQPAHAHVTGRQSHLHLGSYSVDQISRFADRFDFIGVAVVFCCYRLAQEQILGLKHEQVRLTRSKLLACARMLQVAAERL